VVLEQLAEKLKKSGLDREVCIIETGCMGACNLSLVLLVYPDGTSCQQATVLDTPNPMGLIAVE
jgi:predicted metal-binding protein